MKKTQKFTKSKKTQKKFKKFTLPKILKTIPFFLFLLILHFPLHLNQDYSAHFGVPEDLNK